MSREYNRNTSAQNRFVPQGSRNGRGGGNAHPSADASVSIGLELARQPADHMGHPVAYAGLGPDQQDFNGAP